MPRKAEAGKSAGTRAWVITREGPSWPQEVVAIVSARRSEDFIKYTLELLCGLLHYSAEEQLAAARWNRPVNPYEATRARRGDAAALHCGHNPFLLARLARKVRLDSSSRLEWQQPDRFEPSASGPAKRVVGGMRSAPVKLIWQDRTA
jgi:hypothetical protein